MKQRAVVLVGALLTLIVVGVAACSGGGESDTARSARLQLEARARVTPERCVEVVAAQVDGVLAVGSPFYDDMFSCRRAGYDPVWEANGMSSSSADYAYFGKTGVVSRVCDSLAQPFRTALPSCGEALELGESIVNADGKATAQGAEILLVGLCTAIQQTQTPMTASRRSIDEAKALIAAGVCPGDASIFTPSD